MNTLVSFELAKMLKEGGFDLPVCNVFETSMLHGRESYFFEKEYELDNHNKKDGENTNYYSRPTIADVVMWLHEKRRIWICVSVEPESGVFYFSVDKNKGSFFYDKGGDYPSPTEAYEAAIEYTLKKLI